MSSQIEVRMICHIDHGCHCCFCSHKNTQSIIFMQCITDSGEKFTGITLMTVWWTMTKSDTIFMNFFQIPWYFIETNIATMQVMFTMILPNLNFFFVNLEVTIGNAITNTPNGGTKIRIIRVFVFWMERREENMLIKIFGRNVY